MGNESVKPIPSSWSVSRLDDICEILDSIRIPVNSKERNNRIEGKQREELYPYYGATGETGKIDGYLFDGDYLLLGEDGAPFLDYSKETAYLASGKFWVNNHAHVISPNKNINIRYLCEYLELLDYSDIASGSAQPKITQASLNKIKVAIPSINEQQKIASILSSIDNNIEQKQTKLTQTKNLKKSLMADLLTGRVRVNVD